jgi:hypothetical protein
MHKSGSHLSEAKNPADHSRRVMGVAADVSLHFLPFDQDCLDVLYPLEQPGACRANTETDHEAG